MDTVHLHAPFRLSGSDLVNAAAQPARGQGGGDLWGRSGLPDGSRRTSKDPPLPDFSLSLHPEGDLN